MDPITQKTRKSADIQKAELERRSRDLWKVYNPTNQDFEVVLNASVSPEVWPIKAKEEAIVPYYVAQKYWDEMSDKIIINKSDKMVLEENEKRMSKGFPKMNLHTEQFQVESRNLKNLMGKRDRIVAVLNRGLYKEYGLPESNRITEVDKRASKEQFNAGEVFDEEESQKPTSDNLEVPEREEISPHYLLMILRMYKQSSQ